MPYKPETLKKAGEALAKANPKLPIYNPDKINAGGASALSRLRRSEPENVAEANRERRYKRRFNQDKASRARVDKFHREHQRDIPASKTVQVTAEPDPKLERFQRARDRAEKRHNASVKQSARPESNRTPQYTRYARGLSRAASRVGKGLKGLGGIGLFSEFKDFQSQMRKSKKTREDYKKKGLLPGGST